MKKYLLTVPVLFSMACCYSQSLAADPGVNGQLKRMVFIQWDDWQPNPGTFLGFPKNIYGWFFWRVLNNSYYKGQDRRPMRTGGPFAQNYISLTLQEHSDKKIADTTNLMMQQNLATCLNMQGGNMDVPYQVYFGSKFSGLFNDAKSAFETVQQQKPAAFKQFMTARVTKDYFEYLDIMQSRVATIHQSFVDKGVRMEGYMHILKELEPKIGEIQAYCRKYISLASYPTPAQVKEAIPVHPSKTDKQIVDNILKSYTF